jgi:hypothetical protein
MVIIISFFAMFFWGALSPYFNKEKPPMKWPWKYTESIFITSPQKPPHRACGSSNTSHISYHMIISSSNRLSHHQLRRLGGLALPALEN